MQQYLISALIFTPLIAGVVVLCLPRHARTSIRTLALGATMVQLVIAVCAIILFDPQAGLQFREQQPWITLSLGSWGTLQAEYFVAMDGLSLPLVMLSVGIMVVATLSSFSIQHHVKGYFTLLLILNAAIIGTFTALDFLLFYLFFEFMLLPMFFLIGIWGGARREYASVKFFLYTLLGSIFILIAMIGLYLSVNNPTATPGELVHTFNLVHMTNPMNFISNSILDPNNPTTIGGLPARDWAFLLLLVGFAIKLPAFPLHTWLPDAHVEAPTPVSVVLAALLLKIGAYGLLRIAWPIFPEAAMDHAWLVALFGVISIIYGALNAMASKDLKRLIAYSSVSHMGFVLLGLASLTSEGLTGAVYQLVSHGIISAMLFLLAGVLYDRTGDRTITNYSGLASKTPAFFATVVIAFFASMGLPGFSGFIAEIMIFLGAFKSNSTNGLVHESFAIISTLGLALSAGFYLWTIQRMFFGPFHLKGNTSVSLLYDLDRREYVMLVPLAAAAVAFGIFPQLLLNWINPFAEYFVDTVLTTGRSITF